MYRFVRHGPYEVVEAEWRHYGEPRIGIKNTKIGTLPTFSIPPDTVIFPDLGKEIITCPGATHWCRLKCYAKKKRFRLEKVLKSYVSNLVLFLEAGADEFAGMLASKLRRLENKFAAKILRIHVAGDMFSREYIRMWKALAETLPDWQFYTYTRSWRIPELLFELEELRELPNFVLYASTDPDSGPPPEGWLEACCVDTKYKPGFKPYTKTIRCPEETTGITCDMCQICVWGIASVRWEKIRS